MLLPQLPGKSFNSTLPMLLMVSTEIMSMVAATANSTQTHPNADQQPTSGFIDAPSSFPRPIFNKNSSLLFRNDSIWLTDLAAEYCIAHRNSFANLFTIVLYSFVCFVGIFGNTLVIYVVLRFSKMQTVTNIYILNLAIADECFLIGIPFLLYTMRICSWRFGDFMCKAYMVSTSITQFTSSIFLLIMSADRFIAVCHPITSPRYRTVHVAKLVSTLAWLTSAILMMPVILFASTVHQEDGVNFSCNIEWPDAHTLHSGSTFIMYTFALGFATPLCFILCFYYLVIRKLHSVGPKHKSKEKRRSHRKVTRLVLTVITVYVLCWLPHWISQLSLIHSNPAQSDLTRLEILIFLLLGCLAYSNSAMNPVLYAFLSDNFRKSFFKAFVCMERSLVNAQLQLEPSVCTKLGGGKRRRESSMRLRCKEERRCCNQPTAEQANTSSTTATEKNAPSSRESQNGQVPMDVEDTCLILEDLKKISGLTEKNTVLQTDL